MNHFTILSVLLIGFLTATSIAIEKENFEMNLAPVSATLEATPSYANVMNPHNVAVSKLFIEIFFKFYFKSINRSLIVLS